MRKFAALWLLILIACNDSAKVAGSISPAFDEETEKAAILKTIADETDAFYRGDYEGWKQTYVHASYAFQGWSNGDGTFDASTGWEAIDRRIADYLKSHPVNSGSPQRKVERRNTVIKFFSDSLAYLVWDQYNGDAENKRFTHSKDQRLMQKEGGRWKIANVSSFWDYKNSIPLDSLP